MATAVELIDDAGLDALTLRSLAVRLDADPSALYRHFRNKDALLAAVSDSVLHDIDVPTGAEDDWRAAARATAGRLRAVLRSRPGLAAVVAGAPVTPATVASTSGTLRLLRNGAGLSAARAEQVLATVLAYVLGTSLLESTPPAPPEDEPADEDAAAARRVWCPTPDDRDERFEAGLALLLDAVPDVQPTAASGADHSSARGAHLALLADGVQGQEGPAPSDGPRTP